MAKSKPVRSSKPVTLHQIKITLEGSKPLIWRRFVVRSDIRLEDLHEVIQVVMGWENYHLHEFIVGKKRYSIPHEDDMDFGDTGEDETKFTLMEIAPKEKATLRYAYDFGDGWEHKLVVEKILPPDPAFKHPVCLVGAQCCPPEDCGALFGYYDKLEIMADPKHPEHEEITEWMGEDFDPARFELDEINSLLKQL